MNLVALLIVTQVVHYQHNNGVRAVAAIAATAGIVIAIGISKRRKTEGMTAQDAQAAAPAPVGE
jgi:hypothetical protein